MAVPVRVYLISGHWLLHDILGHCLEGRQEIHLHGAATSLRQAIAELAASPVDVVLLDASLDREAAIDVTRQIDTRLPQSKVLPLGLDAPQEVLDFIEAGAEGYLLAGASFEELLRTVAAVHRGEPPCSPEVAVLVCQRIVALFDGGGRDGTGRDPALTRREEQILRLLAAGLANKQIAGRLNIAVSTVKNHVHRVLRKLGAGGRGDVAGAPP